MSAGFNKLTRLKPKIASLLQHELYQKINLQVNGLLKTVPNDIVKPIYALSGLVPPSPSFPEIKTKNDIAHMRMACKIARKVLNIARDFVKVGVSTEEIDEVVHNASIEYGVYPSPLNYKGFPKSVCTSLNDVVCHGIPDRTILKDGDIINVDVSVFVNGFHGDLSETFLIGDVDMAGRRLVTVTKECLDAAILVCKDSEPFSIIGKIISSIANKNGFNVVPHFIGHGIGTYFHGPPDILHFNNENPGRMKSGMTFTIEPILIEGHTDFEILEDGWTCVSSDGTRSAQFEHTILVTDSGAEILTADDTT
ncbi:methionine aminopeptidase 1D, mitochondrial-like [Xenia sp. Carnegie-2017]|uniref:methionine aminopeptidase 1D, mitochondrial-like n=1 Tax=Xenia sp. Carnegie-2017 TaxID=2897299 RepID=UPI001F04AB83|nr:methionine aminopeptidase 1D, mitochondrial-like [Xenia sp. Carnegie-2017]